MGRTSSEVSYYEGFLIDSILTRKRIHLGYLMIMHMISCCESTTRILPYGYFLTRVFKDVDFDLGRETDFEAPNAYNTYDDQPMGRMKFEKAPDGSWVRKVKKTPTQAQGQGQVHLRVEEEVEILDKTLKVAFSRESPSLTFLHFSRRIFGLRLHFLSQWCLSQLIQWIHLLNRHSLSLITLWYHLIRHLSLLTMLLGWIYLLKLAL